MVMDAIGDDINLIRRFLSGQYWSGCRWVIIDRKKGIVKLAIRCFADYLDADMFCRRRQVSSGNVHIRVLGSVLKKLNGIGERGYSAEERDRMRMTVKRYPVRALHMDEVGETELLSGNFYPFVWETVICPLIVIGRYLVIRKMETGKVPYRICASALDFKGGLTLFRDTLRGCWGQPASLWLVGQAGDYIIDCRDTSVLEWHDLVLLYKVDMNGFGQCDYRSAEIMQVHDPTNPWVRMTPVFARYNANKEALTFYDGLLRRVRPGEDLDFMDLRFFDFSKWAVF